MEPGARVPLDAVREAVLALRRSKGMVLDSRDPDSISASSFFLNPILPAARFATLEHRAPWRSGAPARLAQASRADQDLGGVARRAHWLSPRFRRGPGRDLAKQTLALVNRAGASTAEPIALAREVRRAAA